MMSAACEHGFYDFEKNKRVIIDVREGVPSLSVGTVAPVYTP